MISVLIADNNIFNIKTIINSLSSNKEINIDYIAFNDKETINGITKLHPNLVILNFMLKDSYPFEILGYVIKKHLNTKFIIMNVTNNNYYKKLYYYNNVVIKLFRDSKLDNITKSIYEYKNNKHAIKKMTIKELQEIGYSVTHKGTIFLAEIIEILSDNEEYEDFNLKRDLYPIIAKNHKTTVNSVKINIFNATESMYYNCEKTRFYNYFNYEEKPKIKDIIYRVAVNVLKKNY